MNTDVDFYFAKGKKWQTENVQAGRQMRFTNEQEVLKLTPPLKAFIKEAIEVEKSGLKVKMNKTSTEVLPEELKERFTEDPGFKLAFEALTPGRQRGYIFYFSQPKQSKTRISRIEKCVPNIMDGKGMQNK